MTGLFVELPPFERWRSAYLDDDAFSGLQQLLMQSPEAGVLIPGSQFWLFTLYDKGEMSDLTSAQRAQLRVAIKAELAARRGQ